MMTGSPWSLLPFVLMVLAIVAAAMNVLPGPWRSTLPHGIQTVGDIARALTPLEANGQVDDTLMLRVRQMVADQMGMRIEKVLPESRFNEDLGI